VSLSSGPCLIDEVSSGAAMCRSGFTTLPSVLLQEQSAMIFLLKRVSVSWSLAIDERLSNKESQRAAPVVAPVKML
jgi:hypothetical protein